MIDVQGDKSLRVHELPEDPTPPGKRANSNVEAAVEEVDIARIEKIYKYVHHSSQWVDEAHQAP
jgi:hypothetical protein